MTPARRRDALVLLLAVHSGATDAMGYVALGGAFTSVMTGNLVFGGIAAARADGELALLAVGAIVFFVLGCLAGARLAGRPAPDDPSWPPAVTRVLAVEAALVVAAAIGWEFAVPQVGIVAGHALLWCNAVALGLQSSAVQRFGVAGLSTTYLTGTLTTMVAAVAHGRARTVRLHAGLILALICGAALATLCTVHIERLAPVVQLACLGAVLLGQLRSPRRRGLEVSSFG